MNRTVKRLVECYYSLNGEESYSDICTYRTENGEKDIIFDTFEEANEYINEYIDWRSVSTAIAFETTVDEADGINYKEIKKREAEEKEKRRLYLKLCPFCGTKPERIGIMAKCNNCNITLPDDKWNTRKYHW